MLGCHPTVYRQLTRGRLLLSVWKRRLKSYVYFSFRSEGSQSCREFLREVKIQTERIAANVHIVTELAFHRSFKLAVSFKVAVLELELDLHYL